MADPSESPRSPEELAMLLATLTKKAASMRSVVQAHDKAIKMAARATKKLVDAHTRRHPSCLKWILSLGGGRALRGAP